MLKPTLHRGVKKLLLVSLYGYIFTITLVSAKVENSFQSGQYSQSQYKDYYSTTPTYQYPDPAKGAGDISTNPVQEPLLSQSTVQQPAVQGAPNQHVYYYETYPMPDSSRGGGYGVAGPAGNKRCTYMPNGNMRCYSRQDTTSFDYDTTGSDGGDGSGAGLGGLAGLIGLLGLKGLKGLASVLSPIIFPLLIPLIFPIALPVLLPLLLPLLIGLLVPLLLLPIPVITVPAPGRSLQVDFSAARKIATSAFDQVISSDECVERIACEISKMSQRRKAGEWMEKILGLLPEKNSLTKRIHKGFSYSNTNATTSPDFEGETVQEFTCSQLKCKILSIFDASKPKG